MRNYFDLGRRPSRPARRNGRIIVMPTLWTSMRSRWLDSGGGAGMDRLGEHLRRDIGLAAKAGAEDRRPHAPRHIRDRNLSDARTFLTLQPYR